MRGTQDKWLVSTDWLEQNLRDPKLRIFDCTGSLGQDFINRGREKHYARHHIDGAAYLDIASPFGPLASPDAALPFTWPEQERFEAAMRTLGVGNDSRVVLYAGPDPEAPNTTGVGVSWATRAWWLMYHYGVDCAMLDGGWLKWQRENRPISTEATQYPPAHFNAASDWDKGLALKEDVLDAVCSRRRTIVDSLSPASYRGEIDRRYGDFGTRRGHIRHALNLHFESVLDPRTGCFLDVAALRERVLESGIDLDRPVITYCGGGVGATTTGFALKLLGHGDVAIYDGSMMEWNADAELPMTDPSSADSLPDDKSASSIHVEPSS